ncbi:synaptogenesis protein syg-2-like [Centruroides vittatus]|uniref:synaptogenesis protein syg-2-like n=1 Tax=Centruroides vittatus TaxID=120091 RepID=UPI00350F1FF1
MGKVVLFRTCLYFLVTAYARDPEIQQYFRVRPQDREVKEGETLEFPCQIGHLAGEVQWSKDGFLLGFDPEIPGYPRYKMMSDVIQGIYSLQMNDPPNPPIIQGYEEDTPLKEGQIQKLICVCTGGNPIASLAWFRGNNELTSLVTISGNEVSSEIVFRAEAKDNGAIYICQAKNSATVKPLETFVRITVYFPPENVTVACMPAIPRENFPVTVVCTTASSNPASKISWWKNSELISDFPEETINASYGGVATRSELSFIVEYEDDGALFTCHARNDIFLSYIEDKMVLRILYKPRFSEATKVIDIVEGDSTQVTLYVEGNPEVAWFTWSKEDNLVPSKPNRDRSTDDVRRSRPTITTDGPVLEINLVTRYDAGTYICEAENEEGTANASVVLNVLYPATVTNITEYLEIKEGKDAYLECTVDGNPLPDSVITWKKKGTDTSVVHHMISSRKSYLTIINVNKDDAGQYDCIADNDRPVIHQEILVQKVASELGDTSRLLCLAEGYPKIEFEWNFKTHYMEIRGDSSKYAIRLKELTDKLYESTLFVKDIEPKDLGSYECVAKNQIGYESVIFELLKKDVPETPTEFRVINTTFDSILVSWIPGYDGGSEQMYKIRYFEVGSDVHSYIEVDGSKLFYRIENLKSDTQYILSIASVNELGPSNFTEELLILTETNQNDFYCKNIVYKRLILWLDAPIMDSTSSRNDSSTLPHWWWIGASVLGGMAGIVNIAIVCVLRRKCSRRRAPEGVETSSGSEQCSRENVNNKLKCTSDGQAYFLSGAMYDVHVERVPLQKYQMEKRQHRLDEPGVSFSSQKQYYDTCEWSEEAVCERLATRRRYVDPHADADCPDILKRNKYEDSFQKNNLTVLYVFTNQAPKEEANSELSPKTSLTMNIRCLTTSTRSLDSENCGADVTNKEMLEISKNTTSRSTCDVRMRRLLFDTPTTNTEHFLTEETLIS